MASHANLFDWVAQMREESRKPYLLIDTAQAPKSHLKLARWGIPYLSLFEATAEQPMIEIAPLLIPLAHVPVDSAKKVCDWVMGLAYDAPCLCWMSSPLPTDELAEHLRKFHNVGLSDQQTMMLRWYDTRILPVWMACLSPAQSAQFTAGMNSIQYVDRFGATSVLHNVEQLSALPGTLAFGQPLVQLTDRQYGMLVDASGTDVLVAHLRRVITDEINALSPRVLFEFVGKYHQRAIAAGITDLDRQTQYLVLALFTSGHGVDHIASIELFEAPPEESGEFFVAMQELPDEVWDAGPPLWFSHSSGVQAVSPERRRP